MLLTVSKRLEFSASRRLHREGWSEAQNQAAFGEETSARFGTGRNYVAWFVFAGMIEPRTGMLMNISEIKRRAGAVIDAHYDHRFLNEDNEHFRETVPTVENVARQLRFDVAPLFRDSGAELAAVHLIESPERSATAFADGVLEANFSFEFSAARRTISPNLSDAENARLFGDAASPHGHYYQARFTLGDDNASEYYAPIMSLVRELRAELDQRFLNEAVPGLHGRPMTTEILSRYLFDRAPDGLPIDRVRLHERPDFFAEYGRQGWRLGLEQSFSAAHRLQSYEATEEQNAAMYGKCNNPRGHGHLYRAEATIGGQPDERSGTLFNLEEMEDALRASLAPWKNRHLDLETEEFKKTPSTGENIVTALWPRVNERVSDRLERLRLWETANNRFTLRRK